MTRFLCDLVICMLVPNVCLLKSTLTHLLKQIVDLTGLTQSDQTDNPLLIATQFSANGTEGIE